VIEFVINQLDNICKVAAKRENVPGFSFTATEQIIVMPTSVDPVNIYNLNCLFYLFAWSCLDIFRDINCYRMEDNVSPLNTS